MNTATDISVRNDPSLIPSRIIEAMRGYVEDGTPTGSFLAAVIANDLMGAVGRADDDNIRVLRSICGYVYNKFPRGSHGSREIYKNWIEARKQEVPA